MQINFRIDSITIPITMYIKAALCAAWLSSASAFSPIAVTPQNTIRDHVCTAATSTSTSLCATIEDLNGLNTNPKFIPMPSSTTVAAVPKLAQRWRKSTKQLATLGPASSTKEMIEKLFLAGADIFRLNFSHGSQEQKLELLTIIRVSFPVVYVVWSLNSYFNVARLFLGSFLTSYAYLQNRKLKRSILILLLSWVICRGLSSGLGNFLMIRAKFLRKVPPSALILTKLVEIIPE